MLYQVYIGESFDVPWGHTRGFGNLISIALTGGITLAGIILVFLFIGGGVGMIASAGRDDPKAAAQSKQAVTYAVAGFVIIFVAYWIIRVIEEITGTRFVTLPTFDGGYTGGGL